MLSSDSAALHPRLCICFLRLLAPLCAVRCCTKELCGSAGQSHAAIWVPCQFRAPKTVTFLFREKEQRSSAGHTLQCAFLHLLIGPFTSSFLFCLLPALQQRRLFSARLFSLREATLHDLVFFSLLHLLLSPARPGQIGNPADLSSDRSISCRGTCRELMQLQLSRSCHAATPRHCSLLPLQLSLTSATA